MFFIYSSRYVVVLYTWKIFGRHLGDTCFGKHLGDILKISEFTWETSVLGNIWETLGKPWNSLWRHVFRETFGRHLGDLEIYLGDALKT